MGINARSALHPQFTRFAGRTLRSFATATIRIVQPNALSGAANFNPKTNSTDSNPTIIWEGRAQLQVFRQALTTEIPAGGVTQIRSLRFTIPMEDIEALTTPVRKGQLVYVTEVDDLMDEAVTQYQYVVVSGIGGQLGWTRTIEAEADMSVIINA